MRWIPAAGAMKLPKPDRYSVITLGLGAVGGGGLASDFTVLHGAGSWVAMLITAVTIGVLPVVVGWLSPKLWNAALFPIGVLIFLALVTAIDGPLSSDIYAIALVILLTFVYGGGGFLAFCAGWIARQVRATVARGQGKPGLNVGSLAVACEG